jgi:cyclic beta-1,2-glucan synthetase
LSQSWGVLSGAAELTRSKTAMESAYRLLVRKHLSLIQLFDPPFDKTQHNPGYIKGYVPGVRENGGQYTHGAVWLIMAFAQLKDKKRTWELLRMINPLSHSSDSHAIDVYEVEPYVMSADIYTEPSHAGRGGWTWYTGSAGWMYRLIIEYFLGFVRKGNTISFDPCIPEEWENFALTYRFGNSVYEIEIHQNQDSIEPLVMVDGVKQNAQTILLRDEAKTYQVKITLPVNSYSIVRENGIANSPVKSSQANPPLTINK